MTSGGKYIPLEKKAEWRRYYAEDPGPDRRKKVKKHTKESKTTQKGRTRTNDAVQVKPKKPKDDANEGAPNPSGVI
jgi:hypothetical protein